MKIVNKFLKFQEGGAMPQQEAAPQLGGDPMAQILQVAAEAVQSQNCEAAMAVCLALMQLAGGPAGGEAPAQEPTFARNGARLVRIR